MNDYLSKHTFDESSSLLLNFSNLKQPKYSTPNEVSTPREEISKLKYSLKANNSIGSVYSNVDYTEDKDDSESLSASNSVITTADESEKECINRSMNNKGI